MLCNQASFAEELAWVHYSDNWQKQHAEFLQAIQEGQIEQRQSRLRPPT
jgi:hypothetical protein